MYVQVVAPRRRRDRRSAPQEAAKPASEAAPEGRVTIPEGRITVPEGRVSAVGELVSAGQGRAIGSILESALDAQPRGSDPRIDPRAESAFDSDADKRPSGEREVVSERPAGYARRSENSNGRTDMVVVTLPPPPRVPSFVPPGLISAQPEGHAEAEYLGPSVLDAPTTLRPPAEPPGRVSWGVLGLVIALSAIVASALLVALRAPSAPDPEDYVPTPVSPFRVEVTPPPRTLGPTPDPTPAAPARAIAAEPAPATKPAALPERASVSTPTRSIPTAVATSTSAAAPVAKPAQPRTAPVPAPAAPTRAAAPVTAAPAAPAAAPAPSPEQPSELPANPYAEE